MAHPEGPVGIDVCIPCRHAVLGYAPHHRQAAVVLVEYLNTVEMVQQNKPIVASQRLHAARTTVLPTSIVMLEEHRRAVGIVVAGGCHQAAAAHLQRADRKTHQGRQRGALPNVGNAQSAASLRGREQSLRRCCHDKTIGESHVIHSRRRAVGTQIIGLFNLFACQVHHDDAKSRGQISAAVVETHMINLLVAADRAVSDIGNMAHLTSLADVQGRIGVGHHHAPRLVVEGHGADTHICQPRPLGQGIGGILFAVIVEQGHAGGGINPFLSRTHLPCPHKGVVVAPLPDGHLCPRGQAHQHQP